MKRQTDRQTDKKTDRQTDRQTVKFIGQIKIITNVEIEMNTQKKSTIMFSGLLCS